MKKLVVGALVGGLLIFLWQTLSWTILQIHNKEYGKAPGESSIMQALNSNITEDGQFRIPAVNESTSAEEMQKIMDEMKGKPWAIVSYHKSYDADMLTNILKGLAASIISALFACWILTTNPNRTFGGIFIACILIGITGYLYIPFNNHVWWEAPGAVTNLVDVLISWGLCGIWLGWWLKRK